MERLSRFHRATKFGFQAFIETDTEEKIKRNQGWREERKKQSKIILFPQIILLPYSLYFFILKGWYID